MLRQKTEVSLLCTIMQLVTVACANEDPKVTVNHSQAALCGQPLDLTCRKSAGSPKIKEMSWNKNDAVKTLCEWNGTVHENPDKSLGDFTCSYKESGELTLSFKEVKHVNEGEYLCKLYSNLPEAYAHTNVTIQDCCSDVDVNNTQNDPVCTFAGEGEEEVHWSHQASDGSWPRLNATTTTTENQGRVTIQSTLPKERSEPGRYNCSLWDPRSKRYITCRLFAIKSSGTAFGTLRKLWGFSLLVTTVTHFFVKL